jgi:Tfp pilus assembly protein PilX
MQPTSSCVVKAPLISVRPAGRGVSLIVVLIMLGALSLSSAAILRSATSNERISNGFRLQALALQYAQASLRYCEMQLLLAAADPGRVATLLPDSLPLTSADAPAWNVSANWLGAGSSGGSLTSVPESQISSAQSAFLPARLPQCLVEVQALGTAQVHVVTARGFSPDYSADGSSGQTVRGSVVWLQTVLLIDSLVAPPALRDRSWRRIINPPIR